MPAGPDAAERRVLAALDAVGARYEVLRIDPALAATADFCAAYGHSMEASGNCLVVASRQGERRHAACVVPATRRVDVNRVVRRLLGAGKASFAPTGDVVELTGMQPDGVTPFGLPEGLPVYVDAALLGHGRIVVGGGSRSLKVMVDPEVFRRLPGATVVEDLSRPAA